jgi:hypothetical protein
MLVANMATFPARIEIIPFVIESLSPQVDKINLCLNEFREIPKGLAKYSNLNIVLPSQDYKDVGKFIHNVDDEDDVILVDDDIIYPDDYVVRLKCFYEKFLHLNVVVGSHGVIYPDLYDGSVQARKVFAFKHALARSRVVNQLGTGTVFLKGRQIPPLDYMDLSQRFVDVRFSRWQFEHGTSLICIPRESGWLKEINLDETIFSDFTSRWPVEVVKEVQTICGYSKLNLNVVSKVEF